MPLDTRIGSVEAPGDRCALRIARDQPERKLGFQGRPVRHATLQSLRGALWAQHNVLSCGIFDLDQLLDLRGPIKPGARLRDGHAAPKSHQILKYSSHQD
ncbi:MAG: hypothetical protein R3A46_09610 [Thermomicrobiales bacterium]